MTGGSDRAWKMLALADLSRDDADQVIGNALALAARLHAELSLLSVVSPRAYVGGARLPWPSIAYGRAFPEIDVHRVVMPGSPAEALSIYADRIGADLLVAPAAYRVRHWLREAPLSRVAAALTSRPLWVTPGGPLPDGPLRVACAVRLDGTDERPCMMARAVLLRCGGDLVLLYRGALDRSVAAVALERLGRTLDVPWSVRIIEDVMTAVADENFGLIVTGRPMYVQNVDLPDRCPCAVLLVPFSGVSTPAGRSVRNVFSAR